MSYKKFNYENSPSPLRCLFMNFFVAKKKFAWLKFNPLMYVLNFIIISDIKSQTYKYKNSFGETT